MAEDFANISASPRLYPQKLDVVRDTVFFLDLDEADYRRASFLDDRILPPHAPQRWEPYAGVAAAMDLAPAARPLHFILHSGHVGSTLLSRLLDEIPGVLPLREPLPLRTLAEVQDADLPILDARLETFLRLWQRGFASTRSVVLKATSSAARLAPRLLALRPQAKAVYLNLPAEPYLATLLAGPNSPVDLNWHGPERLRRWETLLGQAAPPLASLSLGECAAMSWLVERLTQQKAMAQFGARILPLDFGRLLAAPAQAMTDVVRHFAIEAPPSFPADIARSPVLTRYSKAPEHAYSAELRAELLDEARRDHAMELRQGLCFLEALGARHAAVAEVLVI